MKGKLNELTKDITRSDHFVNEILSYMDMVYKTSYYMELNEDEVNSFKESLKEAFKEFITVSGRNGVDKIDIIKFMKVVFRFSAETTNGYKDLVLSYDDNNPSAPPELCCTINNEIYEYDKKIAFYNTLKSRDFEKSKLFIGIIDEEFFEYAFNVIRKSKNTKKRKLNEELFILGCATSYFMDVENPTKQYPFFIKMRDAIYEDHPDFKEVIGDLNVTKALQFSVIEKYNFSRSTGDGYYYYNDFLTSIIRNVKFIFRIKDMEKTIVDNSGQEYFTIYHNYQHNALLQNITQSTPVLLFFNNVDFYYKNIEYLEDHLTIRDDMIEYFVKNDIISYRFIAKAVKAFRTALYYRFECIDKGDTAYRRSYYELDNELTSNAENLSTDQLDNYTNIFSNKIGNIFTTLINTKGSKEDVGKISRLVACFDRDDITTPKGREVYRYKYSESYLDTMCYASGNYADDSLPANKVREFDRNVANIINTYILENNTEKVLNYQSKVLINQLDEDYKGLNY